MPTARTWCSAAAVAVLLAVMSAAVVIVLIWVWFLVLPVWALLVIVGAGSCFAARRARPQALAYGVAILGSVPLAIVLVTAVLALAAQH